MVSSQFTANVGLALLDTCVATVCDALSGIEIDVPLLGEIEPFEALKAVGGSFAAAAQNALTAAGNALTSATNANANATSAQTQVAALTATQTAAASGGASVTDSFPTVGALSSLGYVCGGSSIGSRLYATSPGVVGVTGAPSASGALYALSPTPMQTPNHQISVVAGDQGSGFGATTLFVRAAHDMSSFAFVSIGGGNGNATIGYGSFGAGTWNLTTPPGASVAIAQAAGQQWTFGVVGDIYTAYCNGQPIVAWNDSSDAAGVSANRCVGFAEGVDIVFGLGSQYGWSVNSLAACDTTPPPIVGTTWLLTRLATTNVALPGSSWQPLGAGTYDTQEYAQGVTVPNLGAGVVQIGKPGPYNLGQLTTVTSPSGTSNPFQAGFYRLPAGASTPIPVATGSLVEGNQVYSAAAAGPVQLGAGDQIWPVFAQAGSNNVLGGAGGNVSYFSGAYCGGG